MQTIQKQVSNPIKNDILITQEMKITLQRMSQGMNENFRPSKNIMDLQKILKQKNQKLSDQLNEKNFNLKSTIDLKKKIAEDFQKYPYREHGLFYKNSYQRDFNTKKFNTNDESDFNFSQNTFALYGMEKQLRNVILQSNFFEMSQYQQSGLGLQWIQLKKLPQENQEIQFIDSKLLLLYSILQKNEKKVPQKTQKKKKILKKAQCQKRVYDFFNDWCSRTFYPKNYYGYLFEMTDFTQLKEMKFNKQKVFWTFVNVLIKKILKDIQTDGDFFEANLKLTSQIYYGVYRGPLQFKYSCISRPNILIKNHQKQQQESQRKRQEQEKYRQTQSFWVKCLMSFFSYQAGKDKLYQYLRSKGYQLLINALQKFYLKQEIQNKAQLKQKVQFSHSYYCRILTKIILNQPLVQSQQVLLSQEEKNILIMIKLNYFSDFHRSMEFKQKQLTCIEKIKEIIQQNNAYNLYRAFQNYLKIFPFDYIFLDFILSYREYLQKHQLLVVFQILLQNPIYLRFSIYSQKQWVNKCLQILEQFLNKETILKENQSLTFFIRIMKLCSRLLQKQQFVKNLEHFLLLRKDLMLLLFEKEQTWTQTFFQGFSLDINCILKIILRSIEENEDYEYFYKKFLSTYVIFNRLQNPTILNTLKHPRINCSIDYNTLFVNVNTYLKNVNQQWRFRVQVQKLKKKNTIFVLGLKILINFWFKLTGQQLSEYFTQKSQQYVFHFRYLNQIIVIVINHIKSYLTNEKQYRSRSRQQHFSSQLSAFQGLLEQWQLFIPQIIQLLEIGDFFRFFFNLNLYFKNEDKKFIYLLVEYLQQRQKKYQGLKNAIQTICKNIQKHQIADKTFGKYLFIRTCQLLKKPLQDIDSRKSRKTSYLAPNFNFYDVQEYVKYLQKVIAMV